MTRLSRKAALGLLAIGPPLAGCSKKTDVAVGSKNFTEELILGEMYAQLLEGAGLTVARKLNLGGTQVAMEALQRGDIDLYPEYTGTALLAVLHLTPPKTAEATYEIVRSTYAQRYDLTWLHPAPFNDTQALATTEALAQRYHISTLSELSRAAPELRLGAIPEFLQRQDGLPGLRRAYGGFDFKSIKLFDIGLKYEALLTGNVDVVVAFGTDGAIGADHLMVFTDDRHFWPAYQVAPVVRAQTLASYPHIAPVLNKLSPRLTDTVMRNLNEQVDGEGQEPGDVAHAFLQKSGLV
ncbi:MAG TPA: glycine betaine ABC transporter substrate-binding protein [Candidatus Acidoferrales bacterium]|nr:glycine betaine ABC transporter substrate-binding protein [Candidatus Acidoferrales bacterium]